jgi:hypothetical protein
VAFVIFVVQKAFGCGRRREIEEGLTAVLTAGGKLTILTLLLYSCRANVRGFGRVKRLVVN